MSGEDQYLRIEDIPDSERFIGIDPLWREDPTARASYSNNPLFLEGAETPPIRSADDSLLAQPEIAEALEQVYLDGTPPRDQFDVESPEDASEAITPIDSELALDGLTWLRKNLWEKSTLRRSVIATRAELIVKQDEDKQQQREAKARAEAQARSREEALRAEQEAERARQAKEEAQRAQEAEGERQIAEAVGVMEESYPYLNFQGFLGLAGKLTSSPGSNGKVTAKEQKGFQTAVNDRVETFLQDPEELVNDLSALIFMADTLFLAKEGRHELPVAFAYMNKIGTSLTEAIRSSSYEDLSDETIERWFSAMDKLTTPDNLPPEAQRLEEARHESDPDTVKTIRKFGKRAQVAQQILVNSETLSNSLRAIVKKDPVKFVERIYMVGDRALDPSRELSFEVALNTIVIVLEDPLSSCTLVGAVSAVDNQMAEFREKATDVIMTLRLARVPWERISRPNDMTRLSNRERLLLSKALLPRGSNGAIDIYSDLPYDPDGSKFREFEKHARSAEGRSTTILGRVVNHAESNLSAPLRTVARLRNFLMS